MILNDDIRDAISKWRPALGNNDDIEIVRLISGPLGKFRDLHKEQDRLLKLIQKRIKEGATFIKK